MGTWKTIERTLRHGAVGRLVRLLGPGSSTPGAVDLERVRRVLFVRPNFRMGNLLLATPALSIVGRSLPEAEIHFLTTPAYRQLLRAHPHVDRVVTFERAMLLRPWSLVGFVRRLRRADHDLVIDGSEGESMTGALFARLSGGRWRVSAESGRYSGMYNVLVPLDPAHRSRARRLADLLEGIGLDEGPLRMSIALDEAERAWAERHAREWGFAGGEPVVGVNIGARADKRWPVERFLEVVRRLGERRDAGVVVFAGPEDLDRLAALEDRLPEAVAVDTTDRVRRFAALLERCALFVTGDTGPMHLAAAVGTPTVSIFLRDDHATFAPIGARHRCVHEEDGDVEPDAVVRAAFDALDSASRSPESTSTG